MDTAPKPLLLVESAGQPQSSLSEEEIRARLEAGTLKPDDRWRREGFSEWRSLAEFLPLGAATPVVAARHRSWRWLWLLVGALVLAYLVSPYISLARMGGAIKSGDPAKLESHIDFPAVRTSLKEDLRTRVAAMMAKSTEAKENPFAALGAAFVPALVDQMVESTVTPSGLAMLIEQGKSAPGADDGATRQPGKPAFEWSRVRYAFFTSPGEFLVDYDGIKLRLRPAGFGWRLYRIEPSEAMLEGLQ